VDQSHVARIAREQGLAEVADLLASTAKPSLRLRLTDAEINPMGSHLGGLPAVPDGFDWPSWRGRPLSFIGQIRLEDLGASRGWFGLPPNGWLSFFYEATDQPWGAPRDAGGWRVVWFPPSSLTVREIQAGPDAPRRLSARSVDFDEELTVAGWESIELDPDAALAARDRVAKAAYIRAFIDFADRLPGADQRGPRHRMFGFPDQIQAEMRIQCELASRGLAAIDRSRLVERAATELAATQWELLLQVDSDPALGTEWGDVGRIYYWIRRDDLSAGVFERSWLILQCT
jgi:uncharacterized protein YwqG